ncbi:hypothetical protein Sste5344_008866 [Sporothrix stenoceras]
MSSCNTTKMKKMEKMETMEKGLLWVNQRLPRLSPTKDIALTKPSSTAASSNDAGRFKSFLHHNNSTFTMLTGNASASNGGTTMADLGGHGTFTRRETLCLLSTRRLVPDLVKLKIEYDAWRQPCRAECSVAAMPADKSLLELLLIDKYPAPHGSVETIDAYSEHVKYRVEYNAKLQYRRNLTVDVTVALFIGKCIRLTVTGDLTNAAGLAEDEYKELVDEYEELVEM